MDSTVSQMSNQCLENATFTGVFTVHPKSEDESGFSYILQNSVGTYSENVSRVHFTYLN